MQVITLLFVVVVTFAGMLLWTRLKKKKRR